MKRLWHWPIDPLARTVRMALGEKGWTYESVAIQPWVADLELAALAPAANAPALLNTDSEVRESAVGTMAICEYLEEVAPQPRLLPFPTNERAEARRLWQWSEESFAHVNATLLGERLTQWVRRDKAPDSNTLRQGTHALKNRLTFLDALCAERAYIAGRHLSFADLSVAAHLSSYDYFGDVPWDLAPDLRNWYSRMKSRPSFRSILEDRVGHARPAPHYADLDF